MGCEYHVDKMKDDDAPAAVGRQKERKRTMRGK